jgi:hypothetical protein
MTRVKDLPEEAVPRRCALCGRRSPDAVWLEGRKVGVCQSCAIEIFPKLMADAIGNRLSGDREEREKAIADHLAAFERHFWKAVSGNLCRVLREWQQAHPGEVN